MLKTKFLLSFLTLIELVSVTPASQAQTYQPTNRPPVADNTLGTQVSGNGNNFAITGGVSKGQTLFHSFTDFSVPTNGQANFFNPVGNRDIITRVTGNVFSDINGLVNTNGANFFLLNPNGIVFGTNAQLNVGKAFVGSTANSLDLVDGSGRMITFGTNASGDAPLLSVAPNVLFDVARLNLGGGTGQISNFGTLQTPNNSQYIGLIGGNVILDGSNGGGKIVAPGGRVDLGGLSGAGSVTVDNNGLVFSSVGVGRSNVVLTDGAGITVRATGIDTVNTFFNNATANGSSINISANNLDLLNAGAISAALPAALDAGLETNSGVQTKAAGNINIDATGKVSLNNSAIKNTLRSGAEGSIGDIKIQAGTVAVDNKSAISTVILGKGNGGNIAVTAKDTVSLTDSSTIVSDLIAGGVGKSGSIDINSGSFSLKNGSRLAATTAGTGNAGDIFIITTGDIDISGSSSSANLPTLDAVSSKIDSTTFGQGNAGKIAIITRGNLVIANRAIISNTIEPTAVGSSKGISLRAKDITISEFSIVESSNLGGSGSSGNIDIRATGNLTITGTNDRSLLQGDRTNALASIESVTIGAGDTGKITIETAGKLSISNRAGIINSIAPQAVGDSQGIKIVTKDLNLANFGYIQSGNYGGLGFGGNIDIKSTGNISISGTVDSQSPLILTNKSEISSNNLGLGTSGKITIDTAGKLSLSNQAGIFSTVGGNAFGNSEGIKIVAGEVALKNSSIIDASTFGFGKAGNIEIDTAGKFTADNRSNIFAVTASEGDAGNITLNANSVTLSGGAAIIPLSIGKGKAGNLTVTTPRDGFITISGTVPSGKLPDGNQGGFSSGLFATAEQESSNVAGKISLTTGTLNVNNAGAISTRTRTNTAPIQPNNPKSSIVDGKYPAEPGAGSIFIDANNINITGGGQILTTSTGNAPAGDIILKNASTKLAISGSDPSYEQRKATLIAAFPDNPNAVATIDTINQYSGIFANNGLGSTGNGGTILLNPFSVKIADGGQISVNNQGTGEGGNIFLVSNLVTLNNGKISADSANTTGGNINLTTNDYLLLRNGSGISTNSGSTGKNGNGGNITIGSPLIVALPGNNDITANAYDGAGGQVSIASEGLFGIQNRAVGSEFTSDITASSTFGQSGTVNIDTPGTDPGRDSTELPNVTTDASNQISQACNTNNRQNKLTVTGRGGLPPNANDPLTSDVVWQDARAVSSPPAISSATTSPPKFAPPAVGWVFDGKGKVMLVAAGTQGQPTGTSVICPNVVK